MTNPAHIADAYQHVARTNHYLVGVQGQHSWDDLCAAEQILIARDNAANNADPTLNLALDLIETDIKRAASHCDNHAATQE